MYCVLLVSTHVVCERLSAMQGLKNMAWQNLCSKFLECPTQVFQECWSGPPPPSPPDNLGTLGWVGLDHHPFPSPPRKCRFGHLGPLGWVGLDHHHPPWKCRFGQLLDYVGTGVWRLITVSPKDTVSLPLVMYLYNTFGFCHHTQNSVKCIIWGKLYCCVSYE